MSHAASRFRALTNACRRWLWRFVSRFSRRKELFINQTVIDRYRDFTEIGEWGVATQNEKGEWVVEVRGKMLAETVKYKGADGQVKLGCDWLPDNDPHVTGFDQTNFG